MVASVLQTLHNDRSVRADSSRKLSLLLKESIPPAPELPESNGPLSVFGWGVGMHLDPGVPSSEPGAKAIAELRAAGISRYRLNVRWDLVMPSADDVVNDPLLDRLSDTIDLLLDAGIEPMMALDNVSIPACLVADGGWRNAATARAYGDFAGAVGARLGHKVREWLTVASAQPYPFDRSMSSALIDARKAAHRTLRAHCPHAAIGTSVDLSQFETTSLESPSTKSWLEHLRAPGTEPDFVALNVVLPGRSPIFVADVLRLLHQLVPSPTFVLAEAHVMDEHQNPVGRLVDVSLSKRAMLDGFVEQFRQLRTEHINLTGTFTWPFTADESSPPRSVTQEIAGSDGAVGVLRPSALEGFRRVAAAGVA